MSDEQLELTLKEAAEKLFRLRMQSQTERLDAPSELRQQRRLIARDQDHSNRSGSKQPRKQTAKYAAKTRSTVSSHAQASCHRRRHERQDDQDAAAWRFRAWCGTRSTARFCAARRSATCTTRTTSRTSATRSRSSSARRSRGLKRWDLVRVVAKSQRGGHRRDAGRGARKPKPTQRSRRQRVERRDRRSRFSRDQSS